MKKFLIYKKLEDGTYGDKLGSYESDFKDDTSANRSYLLAEPLASHFEVPEGADPDCVELVFIPAVEAQEAQGIEGEEGYVPAVEAQSARYELQNNLSKVQAKALATQNAELDAVLDSAIAFGVALQKEFTKQNIVLGITQDNMTGTVRKNMIEVLSALQTGSLYDAIAEAKAIPAEAKDPKYITNARLLAFVNQIEEYLEIPLTQSL